MCLGGGLKMVKIKPILNKVLKCLVMVGKFILTLIKWIAKSINAILETIVIVLSVIVIMGITLFASVRPLYNELAYTTYDKLSNLKDSDFRMHGNTVVLDKDGNELGSINSGDYKYVGITDVNKNVQNAYVAIEDKNFYTHCGFDLKAMTRAGFSLVKHKGEITQGGSTITQQVIKNNLLTSERSFKRKIIELMLAPKIENKYDKAKIMEFYVNTCYYGNNCYGIETASQFYFSKPNTDLTVAECALLAGVSNSPNKYNPIANKDLAIKRRNIVLKAMYKQGYIDENTYKSSVKEDISLAISEGSQTSDNYMVSYAIHCTTLKLMETNGFKFKYVFENEDARKSYRAMYEKEYNKYSTLVRSGGYTIQTTFDQDLQNKLQNVVDTDSAGFTEVQENGKFALQSSGVVIDNTNGTVVAMVGGRGANDQFNRGFLAERQPGSTIKPLIVYGAGLNEGTIAPSSIYTDKKVYVDENDTSSFSPVNADGSYAGDMSCREALARSKNTIAFQIYRDTGYAQSIDYLNNMHFTTLDSADNVSATLCLGGFTRGVTPVDLAKGYATIAMHGVYTETTCLKRVENDTDGLIYALSDTSDKSKQVYTADTAFELTDMMRGTFLEGYGTAHKYAGSGLIAAAKTGTTNSNKDAWFSGFTPAYTCTVWVGYDTPKSMNGMSGSALPAQIWNDFMTSVDKNKDGTDFTKPDSVSLRDWSGNGYAGEDKPIDKGSKTWYECRVGGTEWYSSLNAEKLTSKTKAVEQSKFADEAKKLGEDFLSYKIENVEDAKNLDSTYNKVISAFDVLEDEYALSDLRKSVNDRYTELKATVNSDWKTLIDEQEKDKIDKATAQAQADADDSNAKAGEELKQSRIARADWYLNMLSTRQYSGTGTSLLLEDARVAVEQLKDYSEYNSYKGKYDNAVTRCNSLPPIPSNTPNSNDSTPLDESKYKED